MIGRFLNNAIMYANTTDLLLPYLFDQSMLDNIYLSGFIMNMSIQNAWCSHYILW